MFGIQRFCYLRFVAEKKQQKNHQNKKSIFSRRNKFASLFLL